MERFMLDTDGVTSISDEMYSVLTDVKALSDNFAALDTNCPDGIDFTSAKEAIRTNIDACYTKIENGLKVTEEVVRAHTNLQNTFTKDSFMETYVPGTYANVPVSTEEESAIETPIEAESEKTEEKKDFTGSVRDLHIRASRNQTNND